MVITSSYAAGTLVLLASCFGIAWWSSPSWWGIILRQAGMCRVVEPPHLRLKRDDSPESSRGSGLSRLAHILYSWRGDSHCCVDLVSVSPARGGWRDAASALASAEQGKRDKHARTCRSQSFDFIPFGFSSLGSFGPEAEELLSRMCQRYFSHVRMFGCPLRRRILEFSADSRLPLCGEWPCSSPVGSC